MDTGAVIFSVISAMLNQVDKGVDLHIPLNLISKIWQAKSENLVGKHNQ